MVWDMPMSTFLFYYVFPWGSFLFVILYGIYWMMASNKKQESENNH